jgi:hypothetical protein
MQRGWVWIAPILGLALGLDCAEVAAKPATATRDLVACASFSGWRQASRFAQTAKAKPHKACPKQIPEGEAVVVMDPDAGEGSATVQWRGKAWYVDATALGP